MTLRIAGLCKLYPNQAFRDTLFYCVKCWINMLGGNGI